MYAYRFKGQDGAIHEDSKNDGEHGLDRQLVRTLDDNEIKTRKLSYRDTTVKTNWDPIDSPTYAMLD